MSLEVERPHPAPAATSALSPLVHGAVPAQGASCAAARFQPKPRRAARLDAQASGVAKGVTALDSGEGEVRHQASDRVKTTPRAETGPLSRILEVAVSRHGEQVPGGHVTHVRSPASLHREGLSKFWQDAHPRREESPRVKHLARE